uniref:Uncharacterized protein n=1 Tax=Anguilla anguilla TaxID=7936 RepID=A0A0E9PIM2_ANGAN
MGEEDEPVVLLLMPLNGSQPRALLSRCLF